MAALRVVMDTNVVVSALIFGGKVGKLRSLWQAGRVIPLASQVTITELTRVLAYPKFRLTPAEQADLLADYGLFCESIAVPDELPNVPACRDAFDVPFLGLAIAGQADYLVTGDRDLLSLRDGFVCPIVTIDELLAVMEAQSF